MSTLYRTAGLLGVALLALTACGDEGVPADDQTDEEDGGGTEGQDPDGAEEQGDQPEEIAGRTRRMSRASLLTTTRWTRPASLRFRRTSGTAPSITRA
ncbi:hypothetical protein [Nesterenkonia pannonica]|uniref:hypothetical protein n=1 Tax=Nesterenkonia pannonica TaxID=1548602 RepID=UPI002164C1B8|nr:hypothetical protein [Nesterenkonia pannonica]